MMEEKQRTSHRIVRKIGPKLCYQAKSVKNLEMTTLSVPRGKTNLQTCPTSINTSLSPSCIFTPQNEKCEQLCADDSIKSKASFLMSLNRTFDAEFAKSKNFQKHNEKKQIKLSFMISPKKKASRINFRGTCKPNMRTRERFTERERQIQTMKYGQLKNYFDEEQLEDQIFFPKKQNHINSLEHYFSLAFTKFFAKQKPYSIKERVTVLGECIAEKYKRQPEAILEDVKDIKSIERILKNVLCSKENYVHLSPCEGLDINGDLARLFFNMVHLIVAWKFKNYDLVKVYLQLQYYSRKLYFHQLTLRFCFQLGDIFNLRHDEENAYKYYSKALKMAIYLSDTFNQQKAIDKLGISTYSGSKIGSANYFHMNIHHLSSFDRQLIKQNYSNQKQIQNLLKIRQTLQMKFDKTNKENEEALKIHLKKRQIFNFDSEIELSQNFQLKNRKVFQKNISKYIACPEMRSGTMIAKRYIQKMDKIGKLKRLKNWDGRLLKGFANSRQNQDLDFSNEVMLTHRSLNRINPELQIRQIKREKMLLIQLIGYFTNSLINQFV